MRLVSYPVGALALALTPSLPLFLSDGIQGQLLVPTSSIPGGDGVLRKWSDLAKAVLPYQRAARHMHGPLTLPTAGVPTPIVGEMGLVSGLVVTQSVLYPVDTAGNVHRCQRTDRHTYEACVPIANDICLYVLCDTTAY